jgi:hypothetical protein
MSKKLRYANEYLDEIEKAAGDSKKKLLLEYGAKSQLNYLLPLNYDKNLNFDVPSGMPPHNRDESTHPDLFPPLATMVQRLVNCFPNALPNMNPNLRKTKKEQIFIEIMESISPAEGDILVHCKDKALTELYPSLTPELIKEVLPNFIQ